MNINTTIIGPFKWLSQGEDFIFSNPYAFKKGVYFFTAPFGESNLVYYVGETKKTFAERLSEHLKAYLTGTYHIYDADSFIKGKKELVFTGWGNMSSKEDGKIEYIDNIGRYAPEMFSLVSKMGLFIMPVDESKRILQRIESAISIYLSKQPPPVGNFQDAGIRYIPRRLDEEPIMIEITNHKILFGLPEKLQV